MTDLNIDDDEKIDLLNLENNWAEQPRLFRLYVMTLAHANDKLSRFKKKRDALEAILDNKFRRNPGKYFGESTKVTDKAIQSAIILDKEYSALQDRILDAQLEVNCCEANVKAMYQRKEGLQDEVRLHGQNYFAGPSVPKEISAKLREHMTDSVHENVREKIMREASRKKERI